jgi:hypothetical protein
MTAPVASGWGGCRVGFIPTGNPRLSTAHTDSAGLTSSSTRTVIVEFPSIVATEDAAPNNGRNEHRAVTSSVRRGAASDSEKPRDHQPLPGIAQADG